MENILSAILSHIGDDSLEAMSQNAEATPEQTKSALASAIPILMNALAKNSETEEGASALQNALQRDHDGSLLDNLGGFLSNPAVGNGAGILRHVLGDRRQNVENYISSDAKVGKSAAGKILEMAAPIVMGYLGKKLISGIGRRSQEESAPQSTGGGIGSILGGFLNHENDQSPHSQSVINQILDKNNDGNVVDDIAEMGMSFLGRLFKK